VLFEDKFYQEIHEGLIRILLGLVSHHQLPMIVLNSQRDELNPQAIQGLVFLPQLSVWIYSFPNLKLIYGLDIGGEHFFE
jgi:hypothetical protein